MNKLNGFFITIEGIDGAGKTCNLEWIKTQLEQAGKRVFCTREPGGTAVGEEIRDIILRSRTTNIDAMSELLLLAAARAEHIAKFIRPALARGEWVLCDRFNDATYAYQGAGRGLDVTVLRGLETLVQGNFHPNFTILLDLPVNLGQARTRSRNPKPDRFDEENIAFFYRVRQAYLERAAAEPQRIYVIDASSPLTQVQEQIAIIINNFLTTK